jgi:hypothetical protein
MTPVTKIAKIADMPLEIELTTINTLGAQIVKDEFRRAVPEIQGQPQDSVAFTSYATLVVCYAHTVNMTWVGDTEPPDHVARLLTFWNGRVGKPYAALWQEARACLTDDELNLWWNAYALTRITNTNGAPPELQVTQEEAQSASADFLAATE